MRVGVVGCGYWGSKHVRVLSSLPAVSAVVIIDDRADARASVGADFPEALQRRSLTEALDDVDAVVVATPPDSHFELAAEAITAGKHALVEKPMATTTPDAKRLVGLAEEAGVVLAAGHTFVYNPAVWKLAELVASDALGSLHYLHADRLNLGLYRPDVNVLWDLAAHDISITTVVLGAVPDTVAAWGARNTTGFAEDVANLRMTFTSLSIESTVRASWLDPVKVRRTTIVGSDAMALYDDVDVDARIKVFDRGRRLDVPTAADPAGQISYNEGGLSVPRIQFREPLLLQATDFLRCCRTGAKPMADGNAGLAVVAVLDASDTSLRENGLPIPVDLPNLLLEPSLVIV